MCAGFIGEIKFNTFFLKAIQMFVIRSDEKISIYILIQITGCRLNGC